MKPSPARGDMAPETGPLRIRAGVAGDAAAMLALKGRLRMRADAAEGAASSRGGFLLGSTREQYEALIAGGQVDVLLDGEAMAGFVTALPDAALRRSDLWQRRGQIALAGLGPAELAAIEELRLGYVDQLAVLPDPKYRLCAPVLAFCALSRLLADGSDLVFATVVARPVRNLATQPLLEAVGALRLGEIEETYPEVGAITSEVYCVSRAAFEPEDPRRRLRVATLRRWCSRLLAGE